MAGEGINGVALASVTIGGILVWGGITNRSPSQALVTFIRGGDPRTVAQKAASGGDSATGAPSIASGTSGYAGALALFQSMGFSVAGQAGALGNLQIESGFSPTAAAPGDQPDGSASFGIAQWGLGRRRNLQAYAAAIGKTESDLGAQLGYMRKELTGSYAHVYLVMRGATSPEDAAAYWDAHYEVSSGAARSQRQAAARVIYNRLTGSGGDSRIIGGNRAE